MAPLFFVVNPAAPIFVGRLSERVVWIRVEGKGSFQNSPELKEFAQVMIGRGAQRFVVDLENCPVMDSTFMGTLVGIVSQLSAAAGDEFGLEIINANGRNLQLVESLGLDQVFQLDRDGSSWPDLRKAVSEQISGGCEQQLEHIDLEKRENTEHVLTAHQALAGADEENVPRFRDVIEFLKKELEGTGPT
mgnify:CR=1 FL=1